jgi:hypothetical protein
MPTVVKLAKFWPALSNIPLTGRMKLRYPELENGF